MWEQLDMETPHIAYACVGVFCTIFSLISLFVKERLYIGEATVASIAGLILGPHCLDWFNPTSWGNTDYITIEICRIVLCIQIVAVAVELPRKYMKKHWLSVAIFLVPVMTCGWLVVGLFLWALIPHFGFPEALVVSACVTATDPVLAAAVVGKGKFAERVPGHLRNLLSAESGCNDGMAFPFIFLSVNILIHGSNAREIVKDWILLTILWECFFGVILGSTIGYVLKHAVSFAEKKNLIDRESFLAIFVFIAFISAGLGSMLGVDDLLVSFAAGTVFGWNGDFANKTEESHVSTVIDLLLNLSFFVYFGAIIPWPRFNDAALGLDIWRLIILAFVIIFMRRLPAVVALKPFTPDVKTWREAFFCGHFGPIGVGALFAAILVRKEIEGEYTQHETPLAHLPSEEHPHYQLLAVVWPITCFIVITSIVVHGSSVAVLTLGKRLNRMAITMSFTTTNTQEQGPNWLSRLQKLDKVSTSFSLHRVDTAVNDRDEQNRLESANTVETSGIKVRPAGGAKRRKNKKRRKGAGSRIKKTLSKTTSREDGLSGEKSPQRLRPHSEVLQLGKVGSRMSDEKITTESDSPKTGATYVKDDDENQLEIIAPNTDAAKKLYSGKLTAFQEGRKIIIENDKGEVVDTLPVKPTNEDSRSDDMSIHSYESLQRRMTRYSSVSNSSEGSSSDRTSGEKLQTQQGQRRRKAYTRKDDPGHRKVFAHQIDNFILIENEDGEIVRRYKINQHEKPKPRGRSTSIIGKALKAMNIGTSSDSNQPPNVPTINVTGDLEDQNFTKVLVPDPKSGNDDPLLEDPVIESKIEKELTSIINGKEKAPVTFESGRRDSAVILEHPGESLGNSTEEETSDSENSDDDDESDEDAELEENEIERRRRLEALGQIPTLKRDDDEEE